MHHFLAFIWDAQNLTSQTFSGLLRQRLTQHPDQWNIAFSSDGIAVFLRSSRTRDLKSYSLPHRAGVVLGRLFPNAPAIWHNKWEPTFSDEDGSEIAQSGGRRLMKDYWGSYVAFLQDRRENITYVLRDCSGKQPCYRTSHGGVEIVFADIEDLAPLDLPAFTLNPRYLAAFIYSSQLQVRECGVEGVSEVLAGECVEFRQSGARQFVLWDPRQVCRSHTIESYEEALTELRETTQFCVRAWASAFERFILSLSGGLDSAIVLGCLRSLTAQPSITCLNYFSDDARDDERTYAKCAADGAQMQLIEEARDKTVGELDGSFFGAPRAAKPTVPAVFNFRDMDSINGAAKRLGAEAIWTGQGGDHIFFQMRVSLSAADFVSRHGIGRGFVSAISDAAHLAKEPYFLVLRDAWKLGRSKNRWTPSEVLERKPWFIRSEALPENAQEYVAHQWTTDMADLPKGKQYQINFLAEVLNRHRPMPGVQYAYEHHPLLSQPIIERALQIPTYHLLKGGKQRALARAAFRHCVPTNIIDREDKGETTSYVMDTVRRSETFLREILFNGVLAREGILNSAELEPYITERQTIRVDQFFPLLACISAEIWARTWKRSALKIAA